MEHFTLVLWALFFTLCIPLLLWTFLFYLLGWSLFIFLFVTVGVVFFFRERIHQSSMFQSIVQMLLPFALTFRVYDALRAGKDKRQEDGNIFQIFWASSKGFLQGDDASEDIEMKDMKTSEQTVEVESKSLPLTSAEYETQHSESHQQASTPHEPSNEELDDMLLALKQKMKNK